MDDSTHERIRETIKSDAVVLFMKGTRQAPRCGFSAQVVQILDELLPSYTTIDVLADSALREGIKEYSSWPTVPQLYIEGEFVGGCDIVRDLFQSGALEQKLGVEAESNDDRAPRIDITEQAAQAFADSIDEEDEFVRLEVSKSFDHSLAIGPQEPGDMAVRAGDLIVLLDPASAKRANGVSIDYVETPEGGAFRINNPNLPPRVKSLSVAALKQKMEAGEKFLLLDVRTREERRIAKLEGARRLDEDLVSDLLDMDRGTTLVFICHHGIRSKTAAEQFLAQGFKNVFNVEGGMEAWSRDVDPDVPRY
jgi:monothiol glutaredoxin